MAATVLFFGVFLRNVTSEVNRQGKVHGGTQLRFGDEARGNLTKFPPELKHRGSQNVIKPTVLPCVSIFNL